MPIDSASSDHLGPVSCSNVLNLVISSSVKFVPSRCGPSLRLILIKHAEQHLVMFAVIWNSWRIGSRISGANSNSRAGRFLNRLTRSLGFGQVGSGQLGYRFRTDLHWHVLHTRAPAGMASSDIPYCGPRPFSNGRVRTQFSSLHTKHGCNLSEIEKQNKRWFIRKMVQ